MHRFFYSPGACSLAVHIVLEETGAPYELDRRSSRDSEGTGKADYLALNPKGRVPALTGVAGRAGGVSDLLTEASAILVFLARTYPAARLLPEDPRAEARCLEWLSWLSTDLHAVAYGQVLRPHRFVAASARYPEVQAKGRDNVKVRSDEIEAILADGRDWAVPEGYSIVDPYLLVFWRWGPRAGLDMSALPHWSRHAERVLDRPAVRRALEQEGLV